MKIDEKKIGEGTFKAIKAIGKVADKRRLRAFLVGGIVRDILLNRKNFDVDILINEDVFSFSKEVAQLFKAKVVIRKQFLTATIELSPHVHLDLSSFRSEKYIRPGALPTVIKGSFEDDIFRRDFTINALAMSLNQADFGEIVDPFNGYEDLKAKTLRVFHAKSFEDDPTRILRLIRFEQRFNFRIEPETERLLASALRTGKVKNVSAQRYFAEFKKILLEKNPVRALKRLKSYGALFFIHNRVEWDLHFTQRVHGNILAALKTKLFDSNVKLWLVYFFTGIKDLSSKQIGSILSNFGLLSDEKKTILQLMDFPDTIRFLNRKSLKPHVIYQKLSPFSDEALFFLYVATKRKEVLRNIKDYLNIFRFVQLKIDGKDLKRMGIHEGKRMGKVLKAVLDLKLDQGFTTKQKEINEAKKIIERR